MFGNTSISSESTHWICRCQRITIPSMGRYAALCRALVTVILLASWNVATTHCAFAAAAQPAPLPAPVDSDADACPMHASKPATKQPQQPKNNGCGELPCC